MENKKEWYKVVLENVPHGEEGHLQLNEKDSFELTKILLKNGYAVCMTSGDFDDMIDVHWIYAGCADNLDFADYENIVFTSPDYIEDYSEALIYEE